jgi:hypothetical protein
MRARGFPSATHVAVLWLATMCVAVFGPLGTVTRAVAQATASPPEDAPTLRPGLRVPRPFGELEISTFTRSPKDRDTVFRIEFLIRNESRADTKIYLPNFLRLIADGVPRAPESTSDGCCSGIAVQLESAEYAWATFRAHGQPALVLLQFGTGDDVHSYLRWPQLGHRTACPCVSPRSQNGQTAVSRDVSTSRIAEVRASGRSRAEHWCRFKPPVEPVPELMHAYWTRGAVRRGTADHNAAFGIYGPQAWRISG